MNAGKLIHNLQCMMGMVPNTIRVLSGLEFGWETIPFSFTKKKHKSDEAPYKIRSDELHYKLMNGLPHTNLMLKESKTKQEFYVYSKALKAFLGKDGLMYPISLLNGDCKFESLKSANIAVSKTFDTSVFPSFVIYERMQAEYFNGYAVTVGMMPDREDEPEVIQYGEEHAVFKWLTIIRDLMDEGYIPNYSKIQFTQNPIWDKIKDLDNRGCWSSIPEPEVTEITDFLRNITVQSAPECKAMTAQEYISGSL